MNQGACHSPLNLGVGSGTLRVYWSWGWGINASGNEAFPVDGANDLMDATTAIQHGDLGPMALKLRGFFQFLIIVSLLALGQEAARADDIIFSDDFTDISEGQRPPVGRWQTIGPTAGRYWVASGGYLQSGNLLNQAPSYALINMVGSSDWEDVRVGTDVTMREVRGSVILSVRARDGRNQYNAYFDINLGSGGEVERSVRIIKLANGIPTPISSLSQSEARNLPPFEQRNRMTRLEFEARGSNLIAFVDGREVLRASDGEFSRGTAGIGAANTVAEFEYVAVTPAGVAAPIRHTNNPTNSGGNSNSWRVLIRADLSQSDAESIANDLSNGGVEVVALPRRGRYAVYMGSFSTEAEALEMMEVYSQEGFLPRAVEQTGTTDAEPAPARTSPASDSGYRTLVGLFNTLNQAEARRVEVQRTGLFPVDVLSEDNSHKVFVGPTFGSREEAESYAQQLHADGLPQVGVYRVGERGAIDLSYIAQVSENIQTELTSDEREQLIDVFAEMERLRREGTSDDRRRVEDDLGGLGEQQRRFLQDLEQIRGQSEVIADIQRSAPTAPRTTPAPRATAQELVANLREQATASEGTGDYERAIELWNRVKATDPSGQVLNQANDAISRLQRMIDEQAGSGTRAATTATSDGGINFGLVGGALFGLLVIAAAGFFLLKKKGAAPAPRPAAAGTAATPAAAATSVAGGTRKKSALGGPIGSPITKPAPVPPAPAPAKPDEATSAPTPKPSAKEKTASPEVVGASARIRPGVVSPAPKEEVQPTADSSPSISLAGITGEEAKPQSGQRDDSSTEFPLPPKPDSSPVVHTQPVPATAGTENGILHAQSFDNEELGAVPENWKGATAHDHADLKVVEREGGGRCMRFEKNSGTGSAYFSCRFPDASGRFSVEFDICCQDKNKYLLGFYVEKDEDFRQSISTVIHRDTSRSDKVTLRVQNEVADYELGQWRRVRFVIDLERHIVDAFLDGEPLTLGIRLSSRPDCLNTLSIRDNLATEGILMIDNIEIRKA